MAQAIVDLPQVEVNDAAHAMEHSLEVEIPFLQTILGSFTLLPLVVGDASADEVAEVLERVWGGNGGDGAVPPSLCRRVAVAVVVAGQRSRGGDLELAVEEERWRRHCRLR